MHNQSCLQMVGGISIFELDYERKCVWGGGSFMAIHLISNSDVGGFTLWGFGHLIIYNAIVIRAYMS